MDHIKKNCQRIPLSQWPAQNVKEKYKFIIQVGQGTYGKVYKACLRSNPNQIVALKYIDESKEDMGFPMTALREIKYLKNLNHPNIIKLHEVCTEKVPNKTKENTYLVFEYLEHDLKGLMNMNIHFTPPELKNLMHQFFTGLKEIHSKKIIHRDLKLDNILYSNSGVLKIADFGLAKAQKKIMTNRVQCLKFRAPEILFGGREYDDKVDMWATGILFAELVLRKSIFETFADTERKQVEQICNLLGSPEKEWPEVANLEYYSNLYQKDKPYTRSLRTYLKKLNKNLDENIIDLLDKILVFNPQHRLSAVQCLEHPYFSAQPSMAEMDEMPKYEAEYKTLKQKNKNNAVVAQNQNNRQQQQDQKKDQIAQNQNNNNNNINNNQRRNKDTRERSRSKKTKSKEYHMQTARRFNQVQNNNPYPNYMVRTPQQQQLQPQQYQQNQRPQLQQQQPQFQQQQQAKGQQQNKKQQQGPQQYKNQYQQQNSVNNNNNKNYQQNIMVVQQYNYFDKNNKKDINNNSNLNTPASHFNPNSNNTKNNNSFPPLSPFNLQNPNSQQNTPLLQKNNNNTKQRQQLTFELNGSKSEGSELTHLQQQSHQQQAPSIVETLTKRISDQSNSKSQQQQNRSPISREKMHLNLPNNIKNRAKRSFQNAIQSSPLKRRPSTQSSTQSPQHQLNSSPLMMNDNNEEEEICKKLKTNCGSEAKTPQLFSYQKKQQQQQNSELIQNKHQPSSNDNNNLELQFNLSTNNNNEQESLLEFEENKGQGIEFDLSQKQENSIKIEFDSIKNDLDQNKVDEDDFQDNKQQENDGGFTVDFNANDDNNNDDINQNHEDQGANQQQNNNINNNQENIIENSVQQQQQSQQEFNQMFEDFNNNHNQELSADQLQPNFLEDNIIF